MDFKKYPKIYRLGNEENKDIFSDSDDIIIIQEKIDGANFRFMIKDRQIIFGSRSQYLQSDKDHQYSKNFIRCIAHVQEKWDICKEIKKNRPGFDFEGCIFYGECCVKHSMQYDWDKIPPFLGFDIFNEGEGFLEYEECKKMFLELELQMVPLIEKIKVGELIKKKFDDSLVPISAYAIEGGTSETKLAEGVVFKNYKKQMMAKYVRDKFKELNSKVFGKKPKKGQINNNSELIWKYCTNARIDKMIFKFIDDGHSLDMKMMSLLPRAILKDIYEEYGYDIYMSTWSINFKSLRSSVAKRCAEVLKQVIINNNLNGVQ